MLNIKKCNRNSKMAAVSVLAAMGVFGAAPALSAISFGAPEVPNPQLAKLRGGFDVGGMKFNFAFVSATCVNGSCTRSDFNSSELTAITTPLRQVNQAHTPQLQQVIQVQPGSNGVQALVNGQSLNVQNLSSNISPQAAIDRVASNVAPANLPALTALVQNTANNAVIQHISSLTMTVDNASAMHQMVAAGQILQQNSIRSLPIP